MNITREMYKKLIKKNHKEFDEFLENYYKQAFNDGANAVKTDYDKLYQVVLRVRGVGEVRAKAIVRAIKKWRVEKLKRELKKTDKEFQFFQDFWEIIKNYNIPEENDAYWIDLVKESNKFIEKYNNSQYAKDIMNAFMKSREFMLKRRQK